MKKNLSFFSPHKYIWSIGAAALLLMPLATQAMETIPMHIFVREGCAHCAAEKEFLAELNTQRNDLDIMYHEITAPQEREIFDQIVLQAKLSKSTPITFIGGVIVQGFATADSTGKRIISVIDKSKNRPFISLENFLEGTADATIAWQDVGCDESGETPCTLDEEEYLVHVPIIGTVNLEKYSLPAITAILGLIDGFNPCAMWVLVTFLLVLLQLNDRKKVWQIAGLFIVAEAVMYYLILNVWFTAWDFIGLDKLITPLVGIVAIGAGCFFLYEARSNDGTCKVTSVQQRQKTHLRIKNIANMPFSFVSAIAVLGLAFSVNIIEFACSIGIPQTFTKILDLNHLHFFARQGLMAIYIFMYMLDDFIVFGLALWSTEYLHLTHKYSRISNAVGGALMIALGALLIFYPEALRFT